MNQKDLGILSNLVNKHIRDERKRFNQKLKNNKFESDGHQEWQESYIEYLWILSQKLQDFRAELEEEEFVQRKIV